MQVFQKGIVQTTVALPLLFESVQVHGVKFIMTSHLNQDITENLFSRIRGSGYDHPSPLTTLQRLRSIILGANPSSVFNNTNTEDYNDSEFLVCNVFKRAKIPLPKTTDSEDPESRQFSIEDSNSFFVVPIQDDSVDNDTDSDPDDPDPNLNVQHNCVEQKKSCSVSNKPMVNQEEDAFQYLVGYVAKKLHTQFPELGDYSYKKTDDHNYVQSTPASPPDWVTFLSYGGLMVPNKEFVEKCKILEDLFCRVVEGVPRGKNIVKRLCEQFSNQCSLHPTILKCFLRQRVFIRMKYEAQKLAATNTQRKLKMLIKLKKSIV